MDKLSYKALERNLGFSSKDYSLNQLRDMLVNKIIAETITIPGFKTDEKSDSKDLAPDSVNALKTIKGNVDRITGKSTTAPIAPKPNDPNTEKLSAAAKTQSGDVAVSTKDKNNKITTSIIPKNNPTKAAEILAKMGS